MPKDVRYLSKRRKNQIIVNLLKRHDSSLPSSSLCPVPDTINANLLIVGTLSESNVLFETQSCEDVVASEISDNENEVFQINDTESDSDMKSVTENQAENIATIQENVTEEDCSLETDLQVLIIDNNISHNTANILLFILRKHGHVELPCDVRSLLHTPRKAQDLKL